MVHWQEAYVYIWSTVLEFVLFLVCTCWLLEGDQSPPYNQNKLQNNKTEYTSILHVNIPTNTSHAITHHAKIDANI